MPELANPKHEMVARAFVQNPIAKQAYASVYPNASEATSETKGPELVRNVQVRNRIQEILEGELKLTDSYLLSFGRDKFLLGEDQNIAHKAWRTFLEIKGIINADQSLSIANIVFNESVVQPAQIPQHIVVSSGSASTSDNPEDTQSQVIINE